MYGSFTNDQFLAEKSRNFAMIMVFLNWNNVSTKFVLEAKLQNIVSRDKSNIGLCHNSVANIKFKSK